MKRSKNHKLWNALKNHMKRA